MRNNQMTLVTVAIWSIGRQLATWIYETQYNWELLCTQNKQRKKCYKLGRRSSDGTSLFGKLALLQFNKAERYHYTIKRAFGRSSRHFFTNSVADSAKQRCTMPAEVFW